MTLLELKKLVDDTLASGVDPNITVMATVNDGDDTDFTDEISDGSIGYYDADWPMVILEEDAEKADKKKYPKVFELR